MLETAAHRPPGQPAPPRACTRAAAVPPALAFPLAAAPPPSTGTKEWAARMPDPSHTDSHPSALRRLSGLGACGRSMHLCLWREGGGGGQEGMRACDGAVAAANSAAARLCACGSCAACDRIPSCIPPPLSTGTNARAARNACPPKSRHSALWCDSDRLRQRRANIGRAG